jgi:hypothetical protein
MAVHFGARVLGGTYPVKVCNVFNWLGREIAAWRTPAEQTANETQNGRRASHQRCSNNDPADGNVCLVKN